MWLCAASIFHAGVAIPRGDSGFPGFPCRDASLRNEGCFFLVPVGRSLLRSTTVPERNRGRSPCITARVFRVFVKKEYALFVNHWRSLCVLCGLARKNHPRGNRMVKSPTLSAVYSLCISPAVGRMGINPIPYWLNAATY
mgnify:CR=1 FL=1